MLLRFQVKYILKLGAYHGDAGNNLGYHGGQEFSTKDHGAKAGCARSFRGGWWYHGCHSVQLNGINYPDGKIPSSALGIQWHGITKHAFGLMTSEMAIKALH